MPKSTRLQLQGFTRAEAQISACLFKFSKVRNRSCSTDKVKGLALRYAIKLQGSVNCLLSFGAALLFVPRSTQTHFESSNIKSSMISIAENVSNLASYFLSVFFSFPFLLISDKSIFFANVYVFAQGL